MKIIALVNSAASNVGANGVKRMREALASLEVSAEVVSLNLGDAAGQLRALASQAADTIIVWGGDGTHRSALNTIGRSPSGLILLPGGTRNLLSRALHGAGSWEQILRAVLRAPTQRAVPAGEINDERFFCALLAGAPARMAQARETLRHGDVGRAVGEVGLALSDINDLQLVVRYSDLGSLGLRLPKTNLVAGLVGPLSAYNRMEIAVLPYPSVITTLDVVWSSFNSGFRDLPGVVTVPAEMFEIENEGQGEIPVVIDGEIISAGKHIQARFIELGGYCLTAG